jgi:hypothetical protein
MWTPDQVGGLPQRWNHLVGYNEGPASLIHYTSGGPWFPEYRDCEHAEKWFAEHQSLLPKI